MGILGAHDHLEGSDTEVVLDVSAVVLALVLEAELSLDKLCAMP